MPAIHLQAHPHPLPLPTCSYGPFTAYVFRSSLDGTEHLALVAGRVPGAAAQRTDGGAVLTRIHSESMLGDIFGAERCDSAPQLDTAMKEIAEAVRVVGRMEGFGLL